MAQTGYTPILNYASGTASAVPLAANLTSSASGAELALNYADGKLFYKDSGGVVKLLASSAATGGTFDAPVVISGTTTDAALRITQLGTGNALLVEDSANPDSTPVVIDSSGNMVIGATTAPAIGGAGATRPFSVVQNNSNAFIAVGRYTADAGGAGMVFQKSRGTTVGDATSVQLNDALGTMYFAGTDGTSPAYGALINALVDGTVGAGSIPTSLVFSTTAVGGTSPLTRMRIDSAGQVAIGATPAAGRTFTVSKNITGSTSSFGVLQNGQVQSDVTSVVYGFRNDLNTNASAFTLSNYYHYYAQQGTIGAGSAVTNQYGFYAAGSLAGATNNYGFYGAIPAATGRYNFYAAGTASNYFGGNTIVEVTDNTNAALRITQLGTGNALLVEDSANPDATPFVIDSAGRVLQGVTASPGAVVDSQGYNPVFQQWGTGPATAGTALFCFNTANAANGARIWLSRSRGTLANPPTYGIVSSGDTLGSFEFGGDDGTVAGSVVTAAPILAVVDGTPGVNDMPGRLVFSTTADGANRPTERMRIASTGAIGLSGANYGTSGQVLTSQGSGSAPIWAAAGAAAVTVSNDTSTASNLYPLFATATSGTVSSVNTSNAKLLYKPSTGEFQASQLNATNGIVVNSNTVSTSYSIPSGSSAMSAGPITVASGQSVTVPTGSRWVIL
jgi:hypothetical protein